LVEVLILFYSRNGRTETLAKAILQGVNHIEGVSPKLVQVDTATVNDLISCDAVAFGSPNYFSYMAGLMKDFFDRALSIREKVMGKPAVAFTSGGGSSNSALLTLERMITSFRLEKIAEGIVSQGTPIQKDLEACERIGEALARAALQKTR
jgi:multimeric flavodoxin WrbA